MRGRAVKLLRVQSKLTGFSYKKLKETWKAPAVTHKLKGKWRRIVRQQVRDANRSL